MPHRPAHARPLPIFFCQPEKLVRILQNRGTRMKRKRKPSMTLQPPATPASRYKSILDSLSTSRLLLGEDLTIRYLNQAAENLFETSQTRTRGHPLADLPNDSTESLRT